MKKHSSSLSILASAIIIAIALFSLSNTIENRPYTDNSYIQGSINVQTEQASDYMYEDEAASYLRLDLDYELFRQLITNGTLDGTYVSYEAGKTIDGGRTTLYIFSKLKLDEWMAKKTETNESLN